MNENMKRRLAILLNRVWDSIGDDVLRCKEDAGEGSTCTRDEVMEICTDAPFDIYGKELDPGAFKFFRDNIRYDSPEYKELMLEAFPQKHHGW